MDRRLLLAGIVLIVLGLALWATAPLDLAIHHALLLAREGRVTGAVRWFTTLGGLPVMGSLALAAAGWLAWQRRGREALWLVLTITSGRLVVEGLKEIVQRPRPPIADRLEHVSSWSFPSSHSAGTMMTCLVLALLWGRPGGWIAAFFATIAVGWSRVALGVHWPSDVLAGWGFGLLWIGAASRWRPPLSD